eukprot:SAG11_NODE_3507_length_2406_cov_1.843520_4_plen_104_part_00
MAPEEGTLAKLCAGSITINPAPPWPPIVPIVHAGLELNCEPEPEPALDDLPQPAAAAVGLLSPREALAVCSPEPADLGALTLHTLSVASSHWDSVGPRELKCI